MAKFLWASRRSDLSVMMIFLFDVSFRCLVLNVLCFLSLDRWMLLYLLLFEFGLGAIFLSEPLLNVEGLHFNFGDWQELKSEMETWSPVKRLTLVTIDLRTSWVGLATFGWVMKALRVTRLQMSARVTLWRIELITWICLTAFDVSWLHWTFTSPSLKVTNWSISLIQWLINDTLMALVQIGLFSLSNRAFDPRLNLKALLQNLLSLDRKSSWLIVCLHRLSLKLIKIHDQNIWFNQVPFN